MTILCANCGKPMIPAVRKGHWLHAETLAPQCSFKSREEALAGQKAVDDLKQITRPAFNPLSAKWP